MREKVLTKHLDGVEWELSKHKRASGAQGKNMAKVIFAKDVKIGDAVLRVGNLTFNQPEIVTDVFCSPINDRVYMDFKPHAGSVNGGKDFYARTYNAPVEIA